MNKLVPLITNLSSLNKDYAVFVGAGFSKDAGIPSGWDVLIDTVKLVYLQEVNLTEEEAKNLNAATIEKWYLENDDINSLGYSEILEVLFLGEIERQQYLGKYFIGKVPGEAHKELANLVSMGAIRFIFTTNFDNLIEKALEEKNIDFDVVFSDEILQKTKSWDKVKNCRIYKLHGDYKVGKIRNTKSELKELEPGIASDFQYIIDRHGLIVIGYAGRDEGIMDHFMKRKPYSYPFYWQYVKHPDSTPEYQLFHDLIKKYNDEHNRPISLIQNTRASGFLRELTQGIDHLNLFLQMNTPSKDNFDDRIANSDSKKIRNSTYEIFNKSKLNYEEHGYKEEKGREYSYKYEVFQSLINENIFIVNYIESLLKYDEDEEIKLLVNKLFEEVLIPPMNGYTNEFVKISYAYYLFMCFGTLFLKYNKHNLIDVFWSFRVNFSSTDFDYLINVLPKNYDGWDYISNELYKHKYLAPKYSIFRDHLRPKILEQIDIDKFDSYITLCTITNKKAYKWFNGSALYYNYSFVEIFKKYFEMQIQSANEANALIENYKEKYPYSSYRGTDSFHALSQYLFTQYKIGANNKS